MGHGHTHEHSHAHDHTGCDHSHAHDHAGHLHAGSRTSGGASRALLRAMAVTGAFLLLEAAGGLYSNSLALLSDAAHMLTDFGALALSFVAIWIARRPSTAQMSYGYQRAEVLGALVSAVLIWVLAIGLLWQAGQRFQNPQEVLGPVALAVSVAGLVANLISLKFLHADHHHQMNVRAAYLHVLVDLAGSVGAILSAAVITWTGWSAIDPLVTVFLALGMLWSSWSLLRDTVAVLMEATPGHIDSDEVRTALRALPGIQDLHDLHIWSVGGAGNAALSVHLIAPDTEGALSSAHRLLQERFGIIHTTIQVEHPERFERERCYECG